MSTKSSTKILVVASAAMAVGFTAGMLLLSLLWSKQQPKRGEQKSTTTTTDDQGSIRCMMSPEETLSLIRKRRSIFSKQYSGAQLPQRVLDDMLEAARWAPSHHLTESWHFVVYSSIQSRIKVGTFLAEAYKRSSESSSSGKFIQAKYDKKLAGATNSSFVIALCCKIDNTSLPVMEEICALACAVQNMHLVATSHKVGAYWSSSSVYASRGNKMENQPELMAFLELPMEQYACLGWMFVGDYQKEWPSGRRKPCSHSIL
jgi:nitroreductase